MGASGSISRRLGLDGAGVGSTDGAAVSAGAGLASTVARAARPSRTARPSMAMSRQSGFAGRRVVARWSRSTLLMMILVSSPFSSVRYVTSRNQPPIERPSGRFFARRCASPRTASRTLLDDCASYSNRISTLQTAPRSPVAGWATSATSTSAPKVTPISASHSMPSPKKPPWPTNTPTPALNCDAMSSRQGRDISVPYQSTDVLDAVPEQVNDIAPSRSTGALVASMSSCPSSPSPAGSPSARVDGAGAARTASRASATGTWKGTARSAKVRTC